MIIFTHTHAFAVKASQYLNSRNWANTLLSGRLEQENRTQAWKQLVTKETSILVATDVGARGLGFGLKTRTVKNPIKLRIDPFF